VAFRTSRPGVATGVAWTESGGDVLFTEASLLPSGHHNIILTGQLGNVMQESARAAVSHIRAAAHELGIAPDFLETHDLHVHVPAGAIPKDGPSAGVTIATAILSAVRNQPVREDVAMTGEITLSGLVLPVGGIREKALAARRHGIKEFILPARNERSCQLPPRSGATRGSSGYDAGRGAQVTLPRRSRRVSGRTPARRRSNPRYPRLYISGHGLDTTPAPSG
jgi:ATP-dependent Lon protease